MNVKVSIVVPVYNVEDYLSECLDSLFNQTLGEFEIICVDDGSTDNSLKILREYEMKDNRVKVITQQNQFAGVARNNGLKQATGKYVMFLDSDDFYESTMLEKAYDKAEFTGADIVLFGYKEYNNVLKTTGVKKGLELKHIENLDVFSPDDVAEYIFQISNTGPSTKLYRRLFILEQGLEFQSLRSTNDAYFTMLALTLAKKITYIDETFLFYRINISNNLSSTKYNRPLEFFVAFESIWLELNRRDIYKNFEKSFINKFTHSIVYNYEGVVLENPRKEIMMYLISENISKIGMENFEQSYFYENYRYTKVMSLIKYAREIECFESIRQKANEIYPIFLDDYANKRIEFSDAFLENLIDKYCLLELLSGSTATFKKTYFIFILYYNSMCDCENVNSKNENFIARKCIYKLLDEARKTFDSIANEEQYMFNGLPWEYQFIFKSTIYDYWCKSKKENKLNVKIATQKKENKKLKTENEELKKLVNSKAYKLGNALAKPIRFIKGK